MSEVFEGTRISNGPTGGLSQFIRLLKCRLGFHDEEHVGTESGDLYWFECRHCPWRECRHRSEV